MFPRLHTTRPLLGVDWLREAPFTLTLSGGFFGFFAHTGLLIALQERDLKPRRIVGVSSGALAGGLLAAGLSGTEIADLIVRVRRRDFWDPGWPWRGLLRGERFHTLLVETLAPTGVATLERCPTPLAVLCHDIERRRPTALDRGPLAAAIRASCAVPRLFRPVAIDGRTFSDGGLDDRSGLTAVASTERVLYHHLPPRRPRPEPEAVSTEFRRVVSPVGVPRVSPFRLTAGPRAIEHAYRVAVAWLDGSSS